jgi:hypothetical protein
MRRTAVLASLLAAAALGMLPTLAAPQSLGDAARGQARRRSTHAPAGKSYTDADLHAQGDSIPETSPPTTEAAQRATETAQRAVLDREAAERGRQEASWREQARAALARLAWAQREHDATCGPGVPLGG